MEKYIKIDLELCEQYGISPTIYTWLWLLYRSDERALTIFKIPDKMIQYLVDRNYIKLKEGIPILIEKANSLFEETNLEKKFLELWNLYPQFVHSGGRGIRILRAARTDSKDAQVCRDKYLNIIRNKTGLHNHIIKCLNKQLEMEGNSPYMQKLETWLNQRTYEKYESLEEKTKDYSEDI